MTQNLCNECETVAHCSKHGCIPKQPAQPQRKPLTEDIDVKQLNHCMIAARDWLSGGCDIHDIPRPEISALVAFTAYGIKENT